MSAACNSLRGIATLLACAAAIGAPGCNTSKVPTQRTVLVRQDPVGIVREQLERYVRGQAVDSETALFAEWGEALRQSDPDLAESVEKGLADIQASPGKAAHIAKKLLERLGPTQRP